jgi:hypothetical protein
VPTKPRSIGRHPFDDALDARRQSRHIPHEFVLDAIAALAPNTRRMFGCLAVYLEEKIVLILRDRKDWPEDNGVWLATAAEHHASLKVEFPQMRSIRLLGRKVTHWQVLPADASDFERAALRACELIRAGDPRIGKVPKRRRAGPSRRKTPRARAKSKRAAR